MASGKGDRGGSTNPTPTFTGKVNHGNAPGRGGATHEYKGNFGPIGTRPLGTESTHPSNAKHNVGKPASK